MSRTQIDAMLRMFVVAFSFCIFSVPAQAAATFLAATPYTQSGDANSLFDSNWPVTIEDFEDNAVDPFITEILGQILPPHFMSGTADLTDSVDGDDGVLDGWGNDGHSFFNSGRSIHITFADAVTTAGLVWTDGEPGSAGVTLEAFDTNGMSLGVHDYGDLGDDKITGETPEDRFIGASDAGGIGSLLVTNLAPGNGIEIDHVQWQICTPVPEPTSIAMVVFGVLGLMGYRRRR